MATDIKLLYRAARVCLSGLQDKQTNKQTNKQTMNSYSQSTQCGTPQVTEH